jgi:hypothetical protein
MSNARSPGGSLSRCSGPGSLLPGMLVAVLCVDVIISPEREKIHHDIVLLIPII